MQTEIDKTIRELSTLPLHDFMARVDCKYSTIELMQYIYNTINSENHVMWYDKSCWLDEFCDVLVGGK